MFSSETKSNNKLVAHFLLQQLTVDELRVAVSEATWRVAVDVAGRQDGLHVLILPGLGGDELEQSWIRRNIYYVID